MAGKSGVLKSLDGQSFPTLAQASADLTSRQAKSTLSDFCRKHGFKIYDGNCSRCLGTSDMTEEFSLDRFLAEVKDSCTKHAERKGYTSAQGSDAGDILGTTLLLLGVARDHAIGEIIAKCVEFRREPRMVTAAKIAGWAWRLSRTVER